MFIIQLIIITLKFKVEMINALRLKLNLRIKKDKTKVISFKLLNDSKTLKEVNVIEILIKDYKAE